MSVPTPMYRRAKMRTGMKRIALLSSWYAPRLHPILSLIPMLSAV